jgi:predicted transcriptional regulator
MFQSKQEKEKLVIDLYSQGKTYRQIAEQVKISPNDIHAILKNEEERNNNSTVTNHQQQSSSFAAKAYELFSKGNTPLQVAIALNIRQSEATKYYREYWKLLGLHRLDSVYVKTNGKIWPLWKLYKQLVKQKGMSIEHVVNAIEIAIHKLPHMEGLYGQAKDEVEKMQRTVQRLANDIQALECKISILDATAFSCEQECRRNHQHLQELIDKKNRIDKLIANILTDDNEGYSKLKQIVKENIKSLLSENKELISVSFAALLKTLTSDAKMINIIYKILAVNDGEQHKDNNNDNAIKYLESNKDNILDLAEKHYENLVEALTNKAIALTAASSNPELSLPSSSSTLVGPSNQSDTHRIEESEPYHNSKGDIAN